MKYIVIIFLTVLAFNAKGSEMDTTKLCKKMQSCMLQELRAQSMPENMMQMMKPAIDNMCVDVNNKFDNATRTAEKDIRACLKAMESASCDALLNNTDKIKACSRLH